jgi:hypothetical protein
MAWIITDIETTLPATKASSPRSRRIGTSQPNTL